MIKREILSEEVMLNIKSSIGSYDSNKRYSTTISKLMSLFMRNDEFYEGYRKMETPAEYVVITSTMIISISDWKIKDDCRTCKSFRFQNVQTE